jgi:hypothetical protein
MLEKTLETLENSCGNTNGWLIGSDVLKPASTGSSFFPPEERFVGDYTRHDEKRLLLGPFEPSAGSVIGSGYLCPTWLFQQCNGSSFNNDC